MFRYTAVALLLTLTLSAQQKQTFQVKEAQGEKCTVTSRRVLDLDLTVATAQDRPTRKGASNSVQEKYDREVLEAADGRATKVKQHYVEHVDGGEPGPLNGLDVILTYNRAANEVRVESPGAELPSQVQASFRPEDDYEFLLPTTPVAQTDTWELDVEEMARFHISNFSISPSASFGRCTLKDVTRQGGSDIALIDVYFECSGVSSDQWEMKASVTGKLTFDLTQGRPVDLQLHGEITSRGVKKDDKNEAVATIEGRGTLSITTKYERP